ncbi:MAG: hypothetical protein R3F55_22160 [Alphaproteobacteria bacterium]
MPLQDNLLRGNIAATVARNAFRGGAANWPNSPPNAQSELDAHRVIAKTTILAKHSWLSSIGISNPEIAAPSPNNLYDLGEYFGGNNSSFGNCGEMSAVAFRHLVELWRRTGYGTPLAHVGIFKGNHDFVVIGLPAHAMKVVSGFMWPHLIVSMDYAPDTIGADTVICDPWIDQGQGRVFRALDRPRWHSFTHDVLVQTNRQGAPVGNKLNLFVQVYCTSPDLSDQTVRIG